jgi:hypothetical protein
MIYYLGVSSTAWLVRLPPVHQAKSAVVWWSQSLVAKIQVGRWTDVGIAVTVPVAMILAVAMTRVAMMTRIAVMKWVAVMALAATRL